MRSVAALVAGIFVLAGCATDGGPAQPPSAAAADVTTSAAAPTEPAPRPAVPVAPDAPAAPSGAATPPVPEPPAPPSPAATVPADPEPVATPPAAPAPWAFKLERNTRWPRPEGGLGTCSYPPSDAEKPFFQRLWKDGELPGYVPTESLSRTPGTWGSWIGIVRGYRIDKERNQTRLLVESKHFDGLTDTHILCVSFNGGGDFVAVMPGTGHEMNGLSLVRVYGEVVSVKDDVPRIKAEFVREFPLGHYCFMNLFGEDGGNPRWREMCTMKVTESSIYDPSPDLDYYVRLLGHPRDFVEGKVVVDVPLD